MKRETDDRKRAFAGEMKPSMKRRSEDNDYHGRQIYLITIAVEGRLLLLSPFPHRNNRTTINRATCETLNALAWDISGGQ